MTETNFQVRAEADNPLTGGPLLVLGCKVADCPWWLGFDDAADLRELNRAADAHAAKEHPAPSGRSTATEYGVQVTRPGKEPVTYPWRSLAQANEIQQDWAAGGAPSTKFVVVSRTVTVSDWSPVDPMEATP